MIKLKDLISERINVRKWINAVNKGEDVVVYDKKGKRYNLQGGDNKSVQVTDHWEDAGRRNIHPERTWQTLPLSKVKKIVIEGKLTEGKWGIKGKYLTMPDGGISSIPGPYDRKSIAVDIKYDEFKIYMDGTKPYAYGSSYDKRFKNTNDLVNWLNKERATYAGIDRR